MKRKIVGVFGVLALALSTAAIASTVAVHWQGALRTVHAGDTSGKMTIEQFKDAKNLYAVGPVADLDGEVTALDGKIYVSRVRHGHVQTDSDLNTKASFLVWSEVKEWANPRKIKASFANQVELEKQIETLATQAGLDTNKPFPFLLNGRFVAMKYHVLDPKNSGQGAGGGHTDHAKNIDLKDVDIQVVGFFSKSHEGVFTHKGSTTHLHAVEENGSSGHVDELSANGGIEIKFPK